MTLSPENKSNWRVYQQKNDTLIKLGNKAEHLLIWNNTKPWLILMIMKTEFWSI